MSVVLDSGFYSSYVSFPVLILPLLEAVVGLRGPLIWPSVAIPVLADFFWSTVTVALLKFCTHELLAITYNPQLLAYKMKIFFSLNTKIHFGFFRSLTCSCWLNWNLILVLFIRERGAWRTDCSATPDSRQMGALIPADSAVVITWL